MALQSQIMPIFAVGLLLTSKELTSVVDEFIGSALR